ncbi:DUF4113 domain-containing protein [Billgrantia gudaonensis]|uniref:DUF4113 domain-containing protein n=1 Tax=Billgrantia gudaonensis TaxID=376427 RepID=UPI000B7D4E42|nr:DUF4113 domain-containing protein [Halomonas gudaonensis]
MAVRLAFLLGQVGRNDRTHRERHGACRVAKRSSAATPLNDRDRAYHTAWHLRCAHRTPRWTTRWEEIPAVEAGQKHQRPGKDRGA